MGRWEYEIQTNNVYWSDEIYRLCGYEPQSFNITMEFFESFIHPEDFQRVNQALTYSIENHTAYNVEYRFFHRDGTIRVFLCYGETEYDGQGNPIIMRGTGLDITENRQQKKTLELMAHYDLLTKLPNRTLLADRFSQALAQIKRNHSLLGVCFLDLDNFKPVNDSYGHNVGDQLLIEVAKRIKSCIRERDTVSRFGGDEFVILLGDMNSDSQYEELLKRIHQSLAKPYYINEQVLTISASSGITLYPLDNVDFDTLLRHADQAMYQAKIAGRNRYYLFNRDKDLQKEIKHHQLQEIHQALLQDQLCLYYQPKVNMRTGVVFGLEALIRWKHPEKGLIPPLEFLPIIDGTDLEIQIGDWVIHQALKQLKKFHDQKIELEISINISSHHLQSSSFFSKMYGILEKYPEVNSKFVQLEILESSALSNLHSISHIIKRCKDELGVKVALDDFGTGYSSLTHLRNLAAQTIKIDQSFVRDMLDDPNDFAIIDSVISLAHSFDRDVIAEGVESSEHGLMLLIMGCNNAQGYGISRPLPIEDVQKWLSSYVPNPAWIHCANEVRTTKENKKKLFWITVTQWQKNFIRNLQSSPDSINQWPILKRRKCHCGIWIKRAKQEKLFNKNCSTELEKAHNSMHDFADILFKQYQALV